MSPKSGKNLRIAVAVNLRLKYLQWGISLLKLARNYDINKTVHSGKVGSPVL